MSVTSINHSLTEPDLDSFRYHITSVAQVTGTTFLQNPIILYTWVQKRPYDSIYKAVQPSVTKRNIFETLQ